MHIHVEVFDTKGSLIDTFKIAETQETTEIDGILNINFQNDRFFITPTKTEMTAIKIKHAGYSVYGKENQAHFQSYYPQQEIVQTQKDLPFFWLKLHDFIILKPIESIKFNNIHIDSIVVTCDDN